jgi:hypothetical protein
VPWGLSVAPRMSLPMDMPKEHSADRRSRTLHGVCCARCCCSAAAAAGSCGRSPSSTACSGARGGWGASVTASGSASDASPLTLCIGSPCLGVCTHCDPM